MTSSRFQEPEKTVTLNPLVRIKELSEMTLEQLKEAGYEKEFELWTKETVDRLNEFFLRFKKSTRPPYMFLGRKSNEAQLEWAKYYVVEEGRRVSHPIALDLVLNLTTFIATGFCYVDIGGGKKSEFDVVFDFNEREDFDRLEDLLLCYG